MFLTLSLDIFRNMNIYDVLALLPKLVQKHARGCANYSEGPAERNYKFIKKYKDIKCVRFSLGDAEESRDWNLMMNKLVTTGAGHRGKFQESIPYVEKKNLCFSPCLVSQFTTFKFNTSVFLREYVLSLKIHKIPHFFLAQTPY